MKSIKREEGFTIIEILIALSIMAIGFLAMAEMEFLSLKQKQRAEAGTIATNMIQFISDRDIAEVKRIYLYNTTAYVDVQGGRIPELSYCDGGETSVCGVCPCDPLQALTPNPEDNVIESTCAALDTRNPSPDSIVFRAAKALCRADADAFGEGSQILYMIKRAETHAAAENGLQTLRVSMTYAVKTESQFDDSNFSVSIKDSMASQGYEVTAHEDDYSALLAGWTIVRVPHVP